MRTRNGLNWAGLALGLISASCARPSITPEEARTIARDAYIYGIPLVDQYRVMFAYSVAKGNPEYKGPFNSVLNIARVYTPDDKAFVTPNSDTPYSFASLDLRREPMVLTVPEIDANRYFVFQMMDLYTFNFAYVGTRVTGNGGGSYVIAGPGWKGETPKGAKQVIQSETEFVTLVGRTQLFNPGDLDHVKQIQAGYSLKPLSEFLGQPAPQPAGEIDWWKPVPAKEERISLEFFSGLNFLLQFCPTHPSEQDLRARFARIGIVPGKAFDTTSVSEAVRDAMRQGMADGQQAIDARRAAAGGNTGELFGNREFLKNDYVARATGTQVGIGANSREEALYPIYSKDADGEAFDAKMHRYVIRFPKDQLPPVRSFWSLTMYDLPTQFLVKNPLNRYLINSPMLPDLKGDADGGLTLYIQHNSPGKGRDANWLPAPDGPFMMAMRLYGPKPEALDGSWKAPPVERVKD